MRLSYETTGVDTGEGTFYAKIRFDAKKAKKAGLSKPEIEEVKALVDAVNESLEKNRCSFKIVPLDLTADGLKVKATWKKQKDGTFVLKKIKSVSFKTKVNGKNKTLKLKKDKDYEYPLTVVDGKEKTVSVTGVGNYTGTVTV